MKTTNADPQPKAAKTVYDGSLLCGSGCGCCPVVQDLGNGMVRMHDPSKPENGSFTCTREEYNLLLKHANPIEI